MWNEIKNEIDIENLMKKYRDLVMPLQEIKEISWKWMIFPIATVDMKNGELYKFIIFNESRFEKWFQEYSH